MGTVILFCVACVPYLLFLGRNNYLLAYDLLHGITYGLDILAVFDEF